MSSSFVYSWTFHSSLETFIFMNLQRMKQRSCNICIRLLWNCWVYLFIFFKIKNGWNSFIKSSMGVLVLILFICLCQCCSGKGGKAEGVISLPQWDVHTCDLRIPSLENPKRLRRHVCGRKRRRHEAAFSITPVNALEAECWAQNPRRSPGCCELEGALLWEQGVAVHLTHLLSLQAPDKAPPPSPSSVA